MSRSPFFSSLLFSLPFARPLDAIQLNVIIWKIDWSFVGQLFHSFLLPRLQARLHFLDETLMWAQVFSWTNLRVSLGGVCWPNAVDFPPDLHRTIRFDWCEKESSSDLSSNSNVIVEKGQMIEWQRSARIGAMPLTNEKFNCLDYMKTFGIGYRRTLSICSYFAFFIFISIFDIFFLPRQSLQSMPVICRFHAERAPTFNLSEWRETPGEGERTNEHRWHRAKGDNQISFQCISLEHQGAKIDFSLFSRRVAASHRRTPH